MIYIYIYIYIHRERERDTHVKDFSNAVSLRLLCRCCLSSAIYLRYGLGCCLFEHSKESAGPSKKGESRLSIEVFLEPETRPRRFRHPSGKLGPKMVAGSGNTSLPSM